MDKRLFHGSRKRFEPGDQLAPQPDGYVQSEEVVAFERLVEARRPQDKLSRFEAVFLTADPALIDAAGGYDDAVYLVEPLSSPQASDLAWYSAAWCEWDGEPCDMNRVSELLDRYWSGEPYSDPARSNVEYRVTGASVLALIECNVPIEELELPEPPLAELPLSASWN